MVVGLVRRTLLRSLVLLRRGVIAKIISRNFYSNNSDKVKFII